MFNENSTVRKQFLDNCFGVVTFYDSDSATQILNRLPDDLRAVFNKRMEYCKFNASEVISRINQVYVWYALEKAENTHKAFDVCKLREGYAALKHNRDFHDVMQAISDFLLYANYLTGLDVSERLDGDRHWENLHAFVQERRACDPKFFERGYPMDFYCHDASDINKNRYEGKVWVCKKDILSTHILKISDAANWWKSVKESYAVYDFSQARFIDSSAV